MTSFYNCRSTPNDGQFVITKFDDDMNIESSYEVSLMECACPAGSRDTCRHRKMLPDFLATSRIDTDWFYDFDSRDWSRPFGDLDDPEPPTVEELAQPATEMVTDQAKLEAALPDGHKFIEPTQFRRRV